MDPSDVEVRAWLHHLVIPDLRHFCYTRLSDFALVNFFDGRKGHTEALLPEARKGGCELIAIY